MIKTKNMHFPLNYITDSNKKAIVNLVLYGF